MSRPPRTGRRAAALLACLLLCALVAASAAQAQKPQRILWWNDPVISKELGLSESQRGEMDAAFSRFEQQNSEARKKRSIQNAFLSSLESGDWDKARSQLDEWASSETHPQIAMGEMKLEVLRMLSAEQRKKLKDSYPRVIRRQWRPALAWDRGAGGGKNPFHGARKLQEQRGKKKGPGKKGPGAPDDPES